MRKHCPAFTLIELLVVIAVIAVLMGILLPSLGMARKQAWGVTCLNNLRQIGIAMTTYAQDNDNYVPRALDHEIKWILAFIPYLAAGDELKINDYRKIDVYQCPAFPRSGQGQHGHHNADQTVDYVVNAWDMDNPNANGNGEQMDEPTKVTRIKSVADRIYMADNEAGDWRPVVRDQGELNLAARFNVLDVWSRNHLAASKQTTRGNNQTRRVAQDRHRREGCNNLFFDGHTSWLSAQDNDTYYWCGVKTVSR